MTLQYQFTPDLLGYASYSTGFTAGGYNPRPFSYADTQLTIQPEDVTAYEVGIKSEFLDHKVRVNLDGYYTNYDNIQLSLDGCAASQGCPTTSPFYYGNGGNAEIKGFEAEVEAQPIERLLLNASVGYTDFRYTSLNPSVNPNNDPHALSLNSPEEYAPKWTANFGVQYGIDTIDWGIVTPRLDVTYKSTIYFGPDPTNPYTQQPGTTLLNGRVTWAPPDGKWTVSAFVTNLTRQALLHEQGGRD